jgi:hypothetical protein
MSSISCNDIKSPRVRVKNLSERSQKTPYLSRYGGGWISPVRHLAETMCDRLAQKDRVELPERFWLSGSWGREYRLQTVHASRLLKEFSTEALLAALRTTRGRQVYSLGLKSVLVPLIRDEQTRLDNKAKAAEVMARATPKTPLTESNGQVPTAIGPRPPIISKDNILSRLRDL